MSCKLNYMTNDTESTVWDLSTLWNWYKKQNVNTLWLPPAPALEWESFKPHWFSNICWFRLIVHSRVTSFWADPVLSIFQFWSNASDLCFWRLYRHHCFLSFDNDPMIKRRGVTLSKSLWSVSPYLLCHTLRCLRPRPLQWLSCAVICYVFFL